MRANVGEGRNTLTFSCLFGLFVISLQRNQNIKTMDILIIASAAIIALCVYLWMLLSRIEKLEKRVEELEKRNK